MKNSKRIKTILTAAVALMFGSSAFAQQAPMSNFGNFNEYLLNPSEAGFAENLFGTASHRIQWVGLDGAPRSTFLGIHGKLNEKMGLGGRIELDQTDILKQFAASFSYSYWLKISENTNLSFGVSGVMVQNSIDYGGAVVGNLADEVVNGGDQNGINFDAEAGLMIQHKNSRFGFATTNLFESMVDYELPDNRGNGTFERIRQFKLYASHQFSVSESWAVEPFAMIRNQGPSSFQYEVNGLATWQNTLHLGVGYRQESGFIGRLGFQITDEIIAAYAYEFSGNGITAYSNGSHEFMLGFKLGKRAKKVVPSPTPKAVVTKAIENIAAEELAKKQAQKEAERKAMELEKERKTTEEERKETERLAKIKAEKDKEILATKNLEKSLDINIPFTFEGDRFDATTQKLLDKIAEELKNNPFEKVIIKGHTCDMGDEKTNTFYSNVRANRVKTYLLNKGVNPTQMETKAMNDSEPLVPNTTLENRQKNRRVELELVD